ncbi:MAG: CPBP family intramembrane metalloprotease [Proteobacteria bacterium]|nr:CPBP family intramembrane metalloprotease [Pseudomonadota bacterium]
MTNKPKLYLSPVLQVIGLGVIFVTYLGILQLCTTSVLRYAQWLEIVVPNLWLISASVFWIWRFGISFQVFRGAKHPALGTATNLTMVGLVVAMTVFWPDRGDIGISAIEVVNWIGLLTLVPVAEELFFRGLLLDHFVGRLKINTAAALVTSVIFGFAHLPQGEIISITMIGLSLVLSAVVLATRSLAWPIAIHIGWNALSVIRVTPFGKERFVIAAAACIMLIALTTLGILTRKKS